MSQTEQTESNDAASPKKSLLKKLLPWIKNLIVLIVLVWVGYELYKSWGQLSKREWKLEFGWLALSALFYTLAYFPACLFWRHVLVRMGQKPSFWAALRAYYISQLGKYTPGKAMVVIMRTDIIQGKNVRASFAAASIFFETFTMMSVGAFISAVIMILWFHNHPDLMKLTILSVGMLIFSFLPTFPPFFRFVAKKLGVGKGDPEVDVKLRSLTMKTVFGGWFVTSFCWLFFGLSLWATIHGLGINAGSLVELPKYVAISAISVVLGFVLMTPGGIGAREWALIQFLRPLFLTIIAATVVGELSEEELALEAQGLAIAVAGAQRVVSIVAELLFGTIAFLFRVKKDE